MAGGEGVAYLRGMCISFTMYPTKPMIKTGYQEVSMCGRTSRTSSMGGFGVGGIPVWVEVLVRHRIVDSRDDIGRFVGLLTADANCLRDLHTLVLAACQLLACARKAYLKKLLLIRLLTPCH